MYFLRQFQKQNLKICQPGLYGVILDMMRVIWSIIDILPEVYGPATEVGKRNIISEQKNSSIIRGIWVTTDSFYESVRRLQQSELTREEFESGIQKTLCQTTSLAERYIADIREIDNQTKTISEIRETYREWIRQVYEEYFKMTEIPTVPDDLHDRFNIVEDLAGCVLDMALLLNKDEEYTDGNQWLIKNNIRKYYEGLEKLKIIDEKGR